MDNEQKIRKLEARLSALTEEVRALRAADPAVATVPAVDATASIATASIAPAPSRRRLLQLAGAAAVGAAATVAARSGQVAAADGDPLKAGQRVDTTAGTRGATELVYLNSAAPQVDDGSGVKTAANIFTARDAPANNPLDGSKSSSSPAAVAGYAYRALAVGVYGYSQSTNTIPGYGVVGFGAAPTSVGVQARGSRANLELFSDGASPLGRVDSHTKGEVICDSTGDMWACVTSGAPGVWRKIAGATSAGAFHPLAPSRVYDSRAAAPTLGAITVGQNRLISVASKRDTVTGAITVADIVPAGATAIAVNVTVANTVAGGFVTINPGNIVTTDGATVNWFASGQILNNGVIVKLNESRQVTAVVGGTATTKTDLILDVTGYFL